jgi:hypothetical protein
MSIESPDRLAKADCLPEDRAPPRPEDFIGKIIESDHRVESIEAVGSKFVVFNLRNLKTGEIDQVMKVLRQEFDPRHPLLARLSQLGSKNSYFCPDRERKPLIIKGLCSSKSAATD